MMCSFLSVLGIVLGVLFLFSVGFICGFASGSPKEYHEK